MRRHPARAMYDQLEDALTSITLQLRSAIRADAHMPSQRNGKASEAGAPLHRASGWARQISAELGSVLTVNDAAGFELPEDYAETIFDIYNEALSNVARHAAASRVAITLSITAHEVTMVVRDNGIGLGNGTPASGARGIAAIRARSQTYQGLCEVADASNGGTTVTVSLPIPRVA